MPVNLVQLVVTWRQAVHLVLLAPMVPTLHRDRQRAPPALLAPTQRVVLDLAPVVPLAHTQPQEPLLVFPVRVVLMLPLDPSPVRLVRRVITLVRPLVLALPVLLARTQLMEAPLRALKFP